jgi:hypothetical protein
MSCIATSNKLYRFEDLKLAEGVYHPHASDKYSRKMVFVSLGGIVFQVTKFGKLKIDIGGWSQYYFTKSDKQVSLIIE